MIVEDSETNSRRCRCPGCPTHDGCMSENDERLVLLTRPNGVRRDGPRLPMQRMPCVVREPARRPVLLHRGHRPLG